MTQLGRIVRTVVLDDVSPTVLDELNLVKPHFVLVSNGVNVIEIVSLLQGTITIDRTDLSLV